MAYRSLLIGWGSLSLRLKEGRKMAEAVNENAFQVQKPRQLHFYNDILQETLEHHFVSILNIETCFCIKYAFRSTVL
jgi:hypothetical protein